MDDTDKNRNLVIRASVSLGFEDTYSITENCSMCISITLSFNFTCQLDLKMADINEEVNVTKFVMNEKGVEAV